MKLLIAYDGSGCSRASLDDLRNAGLPADADALILSVSEIWLPPTVKYEEIKAVSDEDVAEYFKRLYEQVDRNLAETKEITIEAREKLQKNFPGWTIKAEMVSAASPARLILSRAAEFKSDLIVVGARGLSSNGIGGLGSVAQIILTEAQCSIRVARGKTDVNPSGLKIFIGFNGSSGAMAAVEAVAAREWFGKPEIRLAVITDPLFPLIPGRAFQILPGWSEEKIKKGEMKWAETLAAAALQRLNNAGFPASLHVYCGNPRMILTREAEEWGADAIFLGARGHGFADRGLLGSVSYSVAARAHCSVEVVRPKIDVL